MAHVVIENLSFRYPQSQLRALDGISLDIEGGSFVVVCGKSACGKSTLLRHLKTVLTPHGESSGRVLFDGRPLADVPLREQAAGIGFVMQNPDAQLVTDKVWHELAFGLENLGFDQRKMRLRVAEMASYFGMEDWFDADVSTLSGGQKQLLNLASVMVMQPDVLVLDEPTSQLDPLAASDFLSTISRINRDLGVTVIVSEHRLEELLPFADKMVVLEGGRVLVQGDPREVGPYLFELGSDMRHALPTPMRIYGELTRRRKADGLPCPLTVREGRMWLGSLSADHGRASGVQAASGPSSKAAVGLAASSDRNERGAHDAAPVLEAKKLWYRYGRDLPDVLKGVNLSVCGGKTLAIVGGNGAGKSTLLKVLAGVLAPYRGKVVLEGSKPVKRGGKVGEGGSLASMLAQDPQSVFSSSTVRGELEEMCDVAGIEPHGCLERVDRMAAELEISHLLDAHPYDLSGGEQQRVALAKVLMASPRVLLLDEPTKGIDAFFKQKLAEIFDKLKSQGTAIVIVSHDVEFCARYADDAALLFDGELVSQGSARELFAGNSFYTTAANRMSRHVAEGLVTDEDVIAYVG